MLRLMEYEWGEEKYARNVAKHGLEFDVLEDFKWGDAVTIDRSRHADGEKRFAAIGLLYGKIHTVIFTWRGGRMRIISLRRANKGEEKIYEKST